MKLTHYSVPAAVLLVIANWPSCFGREAATSETLAHAPAERASTRLVEGYGKLPLRFEANEGQHDGQVKFVSRGRGYAVFLTPTEAVLDLRKTDDGTPASTRPANRSQASAILRMRLDGASPAPGMTGQDELAGKANYFLGNDPACWRTNVPTYAKVQYAQVYPGVDLVFYGSSQQQLEYDFVVAPGADPSGSRLAFEGAGKIELDAGGGLRVFIPGGEVRFDKPMIYQIVEGRRRDIEGGFVCEPRQPNDGTGNSARVSFRIAAYDPTRRLVIDPVLSYSTYLGGSGSDQGNSITLDAAANAYITGSTRSSDFPTLAPVQSTNWGRQSVFVTKLSPAGLLVYSTYLGSPSNDSSGNDIAVDAAGNAYVAGLTWANDFPVFNGFQTNPSGDADGFVVKLNSTGSALAYSTYLGGERADYARGIAVDAAGNAFVTGATFSPAFPTTPGALSRSSSTNAAGEVWDAFVLKINPAGSALVYGTYLGGTDWESGTGLTVDADGNAYVTGSTRSTNFPTTGNAFQVAFGGGSDVFVAKLNVTGSALVYSTYLGGSAGDDTGDWYYGAGNGISVDATGHAYVVGATGSDDFPIKNALQPLRFSHNAFVSKLTPDGSGLVYSTFLGDRTEVSGALGIAVDAAGCAHATGAARTGFPVVNAIQPEHAGGNLYGVDAFVAKLDPDGSALVYSTFLGGSWDDFGFGIAVDAGGNAYMTGTTRSTDFPTANALQPQYGGESLNANDAGDAFVAKIAVDPDTIAPRLVFSGPEGQSNRVTVIFSESVSEMSATAITNYAINNGVAVTAAEMGPNSKTVWLTTSLIAEGGDYTLTVNQVQDRALPTPNTIAPNSQIQLFALAVTNGVLTRKMFFGLAGTSLASLTNHARFPNQPDLVDYATIFESPAAATNDYGVQLKGYLTPPATGDYVFYVCSDDNGALFLSMDANPAHKRQIASEPEWNGSRQWINGANQASRGTPPVNISAPIHLDAGGKYYIEALMKQNGGGDNLSVAWRLPGGTAPSDGGSPIPGQYLSSAITIGPVMFTAQPQTQTVGEAQPVSFRFEVDGTPPFSFQWFRNGGAIIGATNPVYALTAAALSDSNAVFAVAVSNAFGSVTSSNAVLTVLPDLSPPVLVRVRSVTLDQVEVTFSKPVSQTTANNLANFAITNTSGALTISNALLDASQTRVLLTTSRQLENTNHTLTVNGVRDATASGNLIASNSQMVFTPYFPDEFVGPFPSWGDVKRDYGAVGDGVADDTAALQRALDDLGADFRHFDGLPHPYVLYLPAGTYRITHGLNLVARPAVGVLGEDPATTIIKWDGPTNGVMILLNGFSLARLGRLTFDGAGRALSAVDQKWDGAGGGGCAPTGTEYADLVLKDVQFGIRGGNWDYQNNDAEVAVLRCRFQRCSKAGVSMESFNAMDWFVWHSLFEDCGLGVCNTFGAGAAHVQESLFRRSADADIAIGNSGYFFIYHNYSIGSRAFFRAGFNGVNEEVTLQSNTVLDPQEMPISGHIMGPLLLIDNVIRSRPAATGPVAEAGHDANNLGDLVSIGNTYTVTNALRVTGRLYAQDDVVVDQDAVNPPEPELPVTLPNLHRPVCEVPTDADAAAIQQAIDAAALLNGQRPVVHLPGRNYWINRSLVIPAGCDLQLVGDNYYYGTTLWWTGTNASTVLRLASPSRATLREFRIRIDGVSAQAAGISIDGCDQPGARIFGEQVKSDGLLADRLDHARVELRDFYANYSEKQQIAVRVIGGPLKGSGQETGGRVNIFSGASGYGGSVYDLLNGGHLLVRDMYYEGRPPRFMRLSGSGTFTLHSGRCHVDPVANPVIEFKDFHGQASLVNLELNNADVRITGGSGDTRVLGLGLASTLPDAFVNDSPSAQVALLGSRTGYNGVPQVSVPNYTNQIGSVPEFVRQMLAQTRGAHPQPLTHLPEGVTDVRMYRVTVEGGSVGLQLNRDLQATIITQPQDQAALELHSAAFSVTPAGPVPYTLQWFRDGDAIPAETNLTYVIPSVAISDNGAVFSVVVSNEWNSIMSSNATLTVTADATPAQAVLVASYDPGWVVASFDEGLDPASATVTNHYTLSGGALVTGAYLRPDGKSVLLRVAGPLETNFTLAASNLLDRALAHNAASLVVTGSVMGLTGADIGNPGDPLEPGSTQTLPDGTVEVIAGGTDIWNRADDFHYSYQPRVGDFDVRVQVSRLDATTAWSKAGLMVRESLAPNSRQLSALVTPVGPTADGSQGASIYQANWRIATDAPTTEWVGTGNSAGVPYPNAWIRLRREGNIFSAYRGTNGVHWARFARMDLDVLESPLPEAVFLGLATTHTTSTHYQNFSRVNLPPAFNTPTGADVGPASDPLEVGSTALQADGSFVVVAGGSDIWNRTDGFHFTYQKVTGDFDARVQVVQLNPINRWSKAGLMVRENLDPGSRDLAACVTPSGPTTDGDTGANVYQFVHRATPDGDTVGIGESSGVPYPNAWIRLRREGNTFTAYRSTDATNWTQYAQTTLATPFADTVYFGLATTAHDNNPGKTTTALYRNYSVAPPPPGDFRVMTVNESDLLTFSAAADDPDLPAQTLTYSLGPGAPTGAAIDPASGLFTWTPTEAQGPTTNPVAVWVLDDGAPSLSATNGFNVIVNEVNVAPVLPVQANRAINERTLLTVTATATDADLPVNKLTYELENPPTGAFIDTNGVITWTPSEAQGPSTYTLKTIVADNGSPQMKATNSFTVTVNEVNVAPVPPVQTDRTINELTLLTVTATATDADLPANTLTYSLENPPTGATIDTNGVITWSPTEAQGPGECTLKAIVADNGMPMLKATNSFTVTVDEVNAAPVLTAITNRTVNPGQTTGFTITATDADSPSNTLTFSLLSAPAGASIDASSGWLSWRPPVNRAGTSNFLEVRVVDDGSPQESDSKGFAVIVNPVSPVTLSPVGWSGGGFLVNVTAGTLGPDYVLQGSTSLANWVNLVTNTPTALPFNLTDTNAVSSGQRFYRTLLGP